MVFPHAIDFEIAKGDALVSKSNFLNDAQRRLIARNDVDLNAVQHQRVKAVLQERDDCFGGVSVARRRFVNPVSDEC